MRSLCVLLWKIFSNFFWTIIRVQTLIFDISATYYLLCLNGQESHMRFYFLVITRMKKDFKQENNIYWMAGTLSPHISISWKWWNQLGTISHKYNHLGLKKKKKKFCNILNIILKKKYREFWVIEIKTDLLGLNCFTEMVLLSCVTLDR